MKTVRGTFNSSECQSMARNQHCPSAFSRSINSFRENKNINGDLCAEEERKNKIAFRKELHRQYRKVFEPPPKISAKSYIVYEIHEGTVKVHCTFNSKFKMEIASLTKIMTCIVAIEICERFNIDPLIEEIKIGKF